MSWKTALGIHGQYSDKRQATRKMPHHIKKELLTLSQGVMMRGVPDDDDE
jgi:hypothetical protein